MQEATYVIKSKNVFTGNADRPFAGGVAVSGDTIVAVGPDKYLAPYIGEHTEVRDFGDSLVMPGLIDSHTHFAQGAMTTNPDFCVNLIDCTSFEQCMERVVTFADAHPDNEWILGIQIIQFQWAVPEMPTAKMIDEYISDRPVFLQQVDLHTYSVNTCALEKLGITDEVEDPQGGKFLRDAEGHLTGVLSNNAAVGFTQAVYNPPMDKARELFTNVSHYATELGITSVGVVHPTFVSFENPYDVFADLSRDGSFPIRAFLYTDLFDLETMTNDEVKAKYDYPGSKIEWRGYKEFIDGVCSDHTAWMQEPYANREDGYAGEPAEDPQRVHDGILRAAEAGEAVRIHAIGDQAIHFVLDSFEDAEKKYGKQDLRHCIEHNETVEPEDLPRYAELGVAPSIQPMHMVLDMADLAKDAAVGPERAALSWPIRSLIESGACVHLGTDFPVVGIEPMDEVYGAVYRMLLDGSNPEGWFPEERITLAEALRAYTYGSAYAMGVEDRFGTLTPGKKADIVAFDRNLFDCEPADLLAARSQFTMIDGQVVYEK